jgi:hypothetical protein
MFPSFCGITDRRSAAGRAPDALSSHEDRDARPVRCNGWLSLAYSIGLDPSVQELREPLQLPRFEIRVRLQPTSRDAIACVPSDGKDARS